MKSVLISIQPKWCELIASGEKTIEVGKTKPKVETPFKCYIYCTKSFYHKGDGYFQGKYCGKVIGEFVCDTIFPISITYSDPDSRIALKEFPYTCLTDKQIMDYLGNGKTGYGWHISDLKIYDKPKELFQFKRPCDRDNDCCVCMRWDNTVKNCEDAITRPPQSWCYVEELGGNDHA